MELLGCALEARLEEKRLDCRTTGGLIHSYSGLAGGGVGIGEGVVLYRALRTCMRRLLQVVIMAYGWDMTST
jgi:hypothetical protein